MPTKSLSFEALFHHALDDKETGIEEVKQGIGQGGQEEMGPEERKKERKEERKKGREKDQSIGNVRFSTIIVFQIIKWLMMLY